MKTPHNSESQRLKVLRDLKILDTEAEREFDDLVRLAGTICETPISLMSLIDENRQWFKAKFGFEQNETPRDVSFCQHTIAEADVTIVEDASKDPRFAQNPMVTGPAHIRFYAGSPIRFGGESIGALCVKDSMPRTLTEPQRMALAIISNQISKLLEVRLQNNELLKLTQDLSSSERELRKSLAEISHLQGHLELREKQYREIVESATDLIYELDADGKFVFVNNIMEAASGFTKSELQGMSYWELVHPEDRTETIAFYKAQLKRRQETSYLEFRMLAQHGAEVWIGQNVRMFFNSEGRAYRVLSVSRDITERKKFEKSLREAKERAEEATLAKSRFLSMMSHEIRTPMNAIIGLTTLLLDNNPRPDQTDNLKLLRFSGENLLTIINDILDFSKIEANKIVLEAVGLELYKLLVNTKQMLEQRAVEKNIVLNFQYDPQIPIVLKGDPVRIAQIITNLTSNAIKFTEKGAVDLKVSYGGMRDDKHLIAFQIKDTGIGIAADKIDTVFDRFSQAETETTRKYGGTGLGLSITKNLVELMGSSIQVTSTPGVGSCFSFVLALPEGTLAESIATANEDMVHRTDIRVLLVEDNKVNQLVACRFLKRWGIAVELANDGREALEKVKAGGYHVLLMDIQMPVMDGYECSKAIRSLAGSYFKTLPIIALTASAMLGMKDKVLEAGMTDYIAKPFSPNELRSKILKYANLTSDYSG